MFEELRVKIAMPVLEFYSDVMSFGQREAY